MQKNGSKKNFLLFKKLKDFIRIWQFCKRKIVKNCLPWGLSLKRQKLNNIGLGQTSNLSRI